MLQVNVLDEVYNPNLREAIKTYSQWPTIPQVVPKELSDTSADHSVYGCSVWGKEACICSTPKCLSCPCCSSSPCDRALMIVDTASNTSHSCSSISMESLWAEQISLRR